MDNTIFLLVGHAGVGKLTTAKAIAALTGARIVDNHTVNNPIFNLIELYRSEPLPAVVWEQVADVRAAILETIATLSPPQWSFIFTLAAFDGAAEDIAIYHAIRETARRRGARFLPVRLTCRPSELVRRIVDPQRKLMNKDVSAENAATDSLRPLLAFDEPQALSIDNTDLDPETIARRIVAAGESLALE